MHGPFPLLGALLGLVLLSAKLPAQYSIPGFPTVIRS